jgi:hypothetical protein
LMQTAFITREQLDEAVRLQSSAREGRLGHWLLHLGFVDEHQVTVALARQFGLPLIDFRKSPVRGDLLGLIPAGLARSSKMVPVGYDDVSDSLRLAVCGPVNFHAQEAVRRMLGKKIAAYIGEESAIQNAIAQGYGPDATGPDAPFRTLEEMLERVARTITAAVSRRATNIRAELLCHGLWTRLEFAAASAIHEFYRCGAHPGRAEHGMCLSGATCAVAAGAAC